MINQNLRTTTEHHYHIEEQEESKHSETIPEHILSDNTHNNYSEHNNKSFHNKHKKKSTRKISLKSSNLNIKESKEHTIDEVLLPKNKISTTQSYHLNQLKEKEKEKLQTHQESNFTNKSLIFSEQKLTNPKHYSVLKHTTTTNLKTIAGTDNKPHNKKTNKETHGTSYYERNTNDKTSHKKHSMKGSTTKKHSKSVYDYTGFDDNPVVMEKKKHSEKKEAAVGIISGIGGGRKSRDSHNRSTLTHHNNPHHQISTSSITKRVTKSKESLINKLLTNNSIKKTTNNFKVLSKCLKEYIKEEELANNKIDINQIIKMVKAFNKTEIGTLSKPLEELVYEIVGLIQVTVVESSKNIKDEANQRDRKGKVILEEKQEDVRFKTPQRLAQTYNQQEQTFPSSINNRELKQSQYGHENPNDYVEENQIIQNPNDISKTKKFPENHIPNNKSSSFEKNPTSLSTDLMRMEQGLEELKSESKQLQKIIYESSSKKKNRQKIKESSSEEEEESERHEEELEEKKIEIHRLRQILSRQEYLMDKIEALSEFEEDDELRGDENYGREQEGEDDNNRLERRGDLLREE